jgi:hypothetical protein
MNYEYMIKWIKGRDLNKELAQLLIDKWEPVSHAYDNNDYQYSIMLRRSLFSEDITS